MQNPAPVVSQHQEDVQHLKANGRHREEVDLDQRLDDGCISSQLIPFRIKQRIA
jgi:hypothetical protein